MLPTKKKKTKQKSEPARNVFDPEIVDNKDDLTNIPGLTPEKEAAIAAGLTPALRFNRPTHMPGEKEQEEL